MPTFKKPSEKASEQLELALSGDAKRAATTKASAPKSAHVWKPKGAHEQTAEENAAHLDRVASRIATHVFAFCVARGVTNTFHAEDLRIFVRERSPQTPPDSPSRILRDLRQAKYVDYTVVSRRKSLYRIEWLEEAPRDFKRIFDRHRRRREDES